MVNFKNFYENWWNSLPKERQEEIIRIRELEKEHTYYKTSTLLDDNYKGRQLEVFREVVLYRPVFRDGSLGHSILLSFGGYCEYSFDKRFCLKLLQDFKQNPNRRFCINAGEELYVKHAEMIRIVRNAIEALVARQIELTDDYYPELTSSDMGKMLQEMGLR